MRSAALARTTCGGGLDVRGRPGRADRPRPLSVRYGTYIRSVPDRVETGRRGWYERHTTAAADS